MRFLAVLILILTTCIVNAQNKDAVKLFDKGVEAFNKKDFKTADSLFSLSAKIEPHQNTYFNLAAVKNELYDHCGFCTNMYKSYTLDNSDAEKLYNKHCLVCDTVKLKYLIEEKVWYGYIIKKHDCLKKDFYYLFKISEKNGIRQERIYFIDTNYLKLTDIVSNNYDFENGINELKSNSRESKEKPSFPGGIEALYTFVENNLKYPVLARENKIQGMVIVTFVVNETGAIENIKVIKGIGGGCDEEAMRIVKIMPKWIPVKTNGKAVKCNYSLPIHFRIDKFKY